jgi:succinate dehydrogenase / fumarate reductase iron-sulfur subunit
LSEKWKVTFTVYRQKADEKPGFQDFELEINPDEYVLDGIEKIWAYHDRSLVYRHACHHSACGACGMRVNHREKLTCITLIRDVTHDGGKIVVEPLRNMPIISDLAVDMGQFFRNLDDVDYNQVQPVINQPVDKGILPDKKHSDPGMERLVDCLECGLCISACPASSTSLEYLGPAALGANQAKARYEDKNTVTMTDNQDGVWRCHSSFECSEVCPSNFEPGWRIMDLRKMTISARFQHLFGKVTPEGGK